MTKRLVLIVVALSAAVTGCGGSGDEISSSSRLVTSGVSEAVTASEPTAAPVPIEADDTTTTQAPASSVPTTSGAVDSVAVDGLSIGPLRWGAVVADAEAILGVAAVAVSPDGPLVGADPLIPFSACATTTTTLWVVRAGGLTLLFEGPTKASAALTNWQYIGGAAGPWSEIIGPAGVRIGASTEEIATAASIPVSDVGLGLLLGLKSGVSEGRLVWFGAVECVFETEEDLPGTD